MRLLVVHGEAIFCAGAQKMLGYFAHGATAAGVDLTVAMTPNPKLMELLPPGASVAPLPSNQRFSPFGLLRQALHLRRLIRKGGFQVLHGWTARDWETTSLARLASNRPGVGLLHDHPLAPHISRGRRRMMRACASHGLNRVLCVSAAVAEACRAAGYPPERLVVVRNGIPHPPAPPPPLPTPGQPVRLGYLGVFSERKGLRVLFQMIERLGERNPHGWELHLAGGAQDDEGRALIAELQKIYASRPWWPGLQWVGWVRDPAAFARSVDLLLVPSSQFDPFPTVLLEAGSAARPVMAARVGGVPEIVEDGRTGWMFDPGDPRSAGEQLATLLADPETLTAAGAAAAARVRSQFGVEAMAAGYLDVYRQLIPRPRQP